MARAVTRSGEPAYLYLFSWADAGKRARLGACHGEELYFLSDTLPRDWVPVEGEKKFGEAVRTYWTNFAKTGRPVSPGLPAWPTYDPRSNQVLELGSDIHLESASPSLLALQRVMEPI
jgi:para-nitrobenzyl esterase